MLVVQQTIAIRQAVAGIWLIAGHDAHRFKLRKRLVPGRELVRMQHQPALAPPTVLGVSQDRAAHFRKVDSELVPPPSEWTSQHDCQAMRLAGCSDNIARDSVLVLERERASSSARPEPPRKSNETTAQRWDAAHTHARSMPHL